MLLEKEINILMTTLIKHMEYSQEGVSKEHKSHQPLHKRVANWNGVKDGPGS